MSASERPPEAARHVWLAERYPDPRGVEERIRRGRRRSAWPLLGVAVVAGAAVLALLLGTAAWRPVAPPVARLAAGLGLSLVGLVLEVVGLVRAVRRGLLRAQRRSPLSALPARERRRLRRQVAGRAPVVAEDLPALRALAESGRAQRWLLPVWIGLVLLQLGQALQHGGALALLFTALALLLVVLTVLLHRDVRRAERFLAGHARQGPGEGPTGGPGLDARPRR